MPLDDTTRARLAELLDTAAVEARTVPMLTVSHGELSVDEGYAIQRDSIARRIQRGDDIVGHKLGLTSRAKMEQVGVHEPIRGLLTRSMWLSNEDTISVAEFCHPRVEPEIAFLLDAPLEPGMSEAEALSRVSRIQVALEVIDSRYRDFKFTLADVVADNCSSARFVLGSSCKPEAVAERGLDNLGVVLSVNGETVHTASTAAVLGNPVRALDDLATMLAREGTTVAAGQVVLSGGATAAVHVKPGDVVVAEIEGIGTARLQVEA